MLTEPLCYLNYANCTSVLYLKPLYLDFNYHIRQARGLHIERLDVYCLLELGCYAFCVSIRTFVLGKASTSNVGFSSRSVATPSASVFVLLY